ncbi:carbohydrate ABC transporter permease [Bosea caraganae]|uniref:Carbohydrate ABC transporter permease n=1 Tax=Bosea caraganae TaxID=2763117 RepID=A0A370L263_9HYPH|nr:carbohydrate ABC transporter permease [Bosea caraganae]RDJ22194.1 carbohydrate ABC transporter permease [Bosea caraganae]RDJ22719.1 carbohydrate ABC transporter permease [Bosea caraganae]
MVEARSLSALGSRALLYAILIAFAAFYLTPLIVVILNSFRSFQEITQTSVLGFPQQFRFDNWAQAWGSYCIAGICSGIKPYMWNSLMIAIPATLISTLLGAMNGYLLSLWRFKGANLIFGIITFGVFLPAQMKLVPWAITLRNLDLSNTVTGLILIHVVQGMSFTTLFCRNYYVNVPQDLIKAAKVDGAGFLQIFRRIILPLSPPILIVTVIWQFTGIWNEFLYGITFSEGSARPVTAALMALSANIAQAREYGIESASVLIAALPTLLVYLFGGKYFVRGLTAGAVK